MIVMSFPRQLTDDELVRCISWPSGLSARVIRDRLAQAQRFIDFDDTLFDWARGDVRSTFCGRPLGDFLKELPYVIQTWNTKGAKALFITGVRASDFPPPLLIVEPPMLSVAPADSRVSANSGSESVYKNLAALGISVGEVFDDCGSLGVFAPGCRIVTTF